MLTRRGLLRGLGAVIAAPAIVRATSLMALSPVPAIKELTDYELVALGYKFTTSAVDGALYRAQFSHTPWREVFAHA